MWLCADSPFSHSLHHFNCDGQSFLVTMATLGKTARSFVCPEGRAIRFICVGDWVGAETHQ